LSKKSWIVGAQTPLKVKMSQFRLEAGDGEGLLKLIERLRQQVERDLGRPVEVITCYEAGYDGFWLHRRLEGECGQGHHQIQAWWLPNGRPSVSPMWLVVAFAHPTRTTTPAPSAGPPTA
jgi:hypothetical protein